MIQELTQASVAQQQQNIAISHNAIINGRSVAAQSGATFDCISPIDGRVLTQVASCDASDVDIAVKGARVAFNKGVWSKLAPVERKKTLLKLADLIDQHCLELALLETLDMGKPIDQSFNSDIPGAANKIRWAAECIDKLYDQVAPAEQNVLAMVTREACGVIAAIVPWNFPLFLACGKLGPALAMGNSIIIKPAEQSPLTAIRLGELALEAGIPEGVVNIVTGFGETAGQALGLHHDVDAAAFVGSSEVGKYFLRYSAESNMKKIFLECGGKSPNLIFADCPDLSQAVAASVRGVYTNSGQICCAPTRLLVEEKIHDQVVEMMHAESAQYQPGNPLDPATKMGSIVNDVQMQRILDYISIGSDEGATQVCGGSQALIDSSGFYIEPTIFSNVKNSMKIAQEEIFGPVISVIPFKSMDEAIEIANDTTYGLAASLWTSDLSTAHQAAQAIRAGAVSVNCIDTGNSSTTFGGYKQSGIGRDGGFQQFDNYSELKTTWIQFD